MKISPVFLKYDYGQAERGISLERKCFYTALSELSNDIHPFWLEENGFPDDIEGLQKRLLSFVKVTQPDLVFFILMKDEIQPKTIQTITQQCTTVNWFCDDQWRFEDFTRHVAPLLTYPITTDKYSVDKYRQIGCSNPILSQFGTIEYLPASAIKNPEYTCDVSFIGGHNPTREWYINHLRKSGFNVACFGQGWNSGRVDFDTMKTIILSSRINLNLSNSVTYDYRFINEVKPSDSWINRCIHPVKHARQKRQYLERVDYVSNCAKNVEQIKARNFEIPGFGGFQLTNYCLSLEDYYQIGTEVAIFVSIDTLVDQARYYLDNEEEREQIRRAGHLRSKTYTYKHRLQTVLKQISS